MNLAKLKFNAKTVEKSLGVVLRTPGLFMIDAGYVSFTGEPADEDVSVTLFRLAGLFAGFLFLLLPIETLVSVYMHLISLALLRFVEYMSAVYIEEEFGDLYQPEDTYEYWRRQVLQVLSISFISGFIIWACDIKSTFVKSVTTVYVIPVVARHVIQTEDGVALAHGIVTLIVVAVVAMYAIYIVWRSIKFFQEFYKLGKLLVQIYGFFNSAAFLASRMVDHKQFILMWSVMFCNQAWLEYNQLQNRSFVISDDSDWYVLLLLVMSEICNSPVTLIASCVTIMVASNLIVMSVIYYLSTCKSHAPPSIAVQSGLTEGMVMFLLSLQTGLIDLKMPNRLGAMTIILFIVAASLLQTILEVTHPVLLALSSSSRNVWSHVKVLILCFLLIVVPGHMSKVLVDTVDLDIWTIVVISSSLLTSIQVIGHVIHYALYVYDSHRDEPLESLDDIVYYLKAVIHSLELISALFVVGAGIKDGFSGDWSLLHSLVLSVHCYFNVLIRIKKGWRSFIMRQAAVSRIERLKDATEDQLRAHNDVCSICYADMQASAKITPCGHFFHGGCLKKWLYVQENCPMCSAKVIEEKKQDAPTDDEDFEDEDEAQAEEHDHLQPPLPTQQLQQQQQQTDLLINPDT